MLKIIVPANFIPERIYILNFFFKETFGVYFQCVLDSNELHTTILFPNGNKLIIKDNFFSLLNESVGYLDAKNIPGKIEFVKNEYTVEKDIPIIFGNDELLENECTITCGIDVFASSFFMLARWEEYLIDSYDERNRFRSSGSLADKFNFLYRPIVNEYAEMLWNMMKKLGLSQLRKPSIYQLIPTHDIDRIYYPFDFITAMGDVFKTKKLLAPLTRYLYFLANKNPYNTFGWLMDISEKYNLTSRFYLMSNGTSKFDNTYRLGDPFLEIILKEIKIRGHIIGFHPGYNTYDNNEEWYNQKKFIEEHIQQEVKEGRQHYLRCKLPLTLQIWEKNKMCVDSTLGYFDKEGFRCGTGNEFFVFNFIKRETLNLKERPLILMDTTLRSYTFHKNYSVDKIIDAFRYYSGVCKKYKMQYTILFHNSSFDIIRWNGWKEIYEELFQEIK